MVRDILDRCRSCGQPLKNMVAYLPNIGEVCFDCYKKAAKESEEAPKTKPKTPR